MGRKRNDLNLTWDRTYHGLADIFERMADQYDSLVNQHPTARVQLTSRADGLRDAAETTRGLAKQAGAA